MSLVDGSDAVAILIACFAKFDVPYMIVGSLSSNAYGIPRATADADIVVENLEGAFEAIHQGLPSEFRSNPQIEFELMTGTTRRVIEFIPTNFKIELFELSRDNFDQARFKRRVSVQHSTLGDNVWIPTAEDVVIQKLRWGRPRDLSDVGDVVAVQHELLDWAYIQRWTDQHQTSAQMTTIRNEI